MNKLVDYRIIGGWDNLYLADCVRKLIKEDWVPLGGPFMTGDRWYQAMVSEKEKGTIVHSIVDGELVTTVTIDEGKR
jgi:hypothetical protein